MLLWQRKIVKDHIEEVELTRYLRYLITRSSHYFPRLHRGNPDCNFR